MPGDTTIRPPPRWEASGWNEHAVSGGAKIPATGAGTRWRTSRSRARSSPFCRRLRKTRASSNIRQSELKRRWRRPKWRLRPTWAAPKSWAMPVARSPISGTVERGVEILRQAVEIDPSNAQAEVASRRGACDDGRSRRRNHARCATASGSAPATGGWDFGAGRWDEFLLRANRAEEALEEARIAARRDPRLYLPPILEAVAQATLGRTELARARSCPRGVSGRNLRSKRSKGLMDGAPPGFCRAFGMPPSGERFGGGDDDAHREPHAEKTKTRLSDQPGFQNQAP